MLPKINLRYPIILQLITRSRARLRRPGQSTGCLEYTGYCRPGCSPIVQYALRRHTLPEFMWTVRHDDPKPPTHVVYHTCGNLKCIERTHMVLRLASDVARERVRKRPVGQRGFVGLRGEANPRAVLSEENVLYMRRKYEEGASIRSIARELDIAYSHAHGIVKRQHWTHI